MKVRKFCPKCETVWGATHIKNATRDFVTRICPKCKRKEVSNG